MNNSCNWNSYTDLSAPNILKTWRAFWTLQSINSLLLVDFGLSSAEFAVPAIASLLNSSSNLVDVFFFINRHELINLSFFILHILQL